MDYNQSYFDQLNYKIRQAKNDPSFAKFNVPKTVQETLIRNLQQAQYPNSKLHEPINNFTTFLPNEDNKKPYEKMFYMENYNDPRVLEYKQPPQKTIVLCSKSPIMKMSPDNEKLYSQTKHHNLFPVPIPTLGTNNLSKLSNPDINTLTSFEYKKYGNNNQYYIDNPIYYSPLSEETIEQYNEYVDSRTQFRDNMIKGIIEDMEILSTNDVQSDANDVFQSKTIKFIQSS